MLLDIISITLGLIGLSFGLLCALRLYRWERQLRGGRIAIAYKGKVKLNAPLIDWFNWINSLDRDRNATGHTIYKLGSTTVAILKRLPPPKAKSTVRKEDSQNGRSRPLHNLAQRRRASRT